MAGADVVSLKPGHAEADVEGHAVHEDVVEVVDPDAETRDALSSFLQQEGFRPTELEDSSMAPGAIQDGRYHMVLLDLSATGMNGQRLQDALSSVNITSNKNPIPFDSAKPSEWRGVRLGVAAATTRGFREAEFRDIGKIIANVVNQDMRPGDGLHRACLEVVAGLCERFPVYRGVSQL